MAGRHRSPDNFRPASFLLPDLWGGGIDGLDPDRSHCAPHFRRWFRLFPVGVWRGHRYRRDFASPARRLPVCRTHGDTLIHTGAENLGLARLTVISEALAHTRRDCPGGTEPLAFIPR